MVRLRSQALASALYCKPYRLQLNGHDAFFNSEVIFVNTEFASTTVRSQTVFVTPALGNVYARRSFPP
jgi:hypothetical protein